MTSFIATDLEGTLSAAEGWRSIRHYFDTHNRKSAFQNFFIRQIPRVYLNRFGIIDVQTLRNKWMEDMAAIFKGFTADQLAEVGEWVIDNHIWPERREAGGGQAEIRSGQSLPLGDSAAGRDVSVSRSRG